MKQTQPSHVEPKLETSIAIVDEATLHDKVHIIRGQGVMLDFELAEIYGYSTKAFNQQVKNNIDKFDSDFRFRLTKTEWDNLRSKKLTSSWGGTRYTSYAFTEQGVYMLMTVLKGELATRQSKALIRLFRRMKDCVEDGRALVGQREFLTLSMQVAESLSETIRLRHELNEVEADVAKVIDEMDDCMRKSELGSIIENLGEAAEKYGWMLFDGQPVEAAAAYTEIYESAQGSIFVVDNYIGPRTLSLLAKAHDGVTVTLFTDNLAHYLHEADIDAFHSEYPGIALEVRPIGGFVHDRFIALDYGADAEKVFHCGASSKDAGKRVTTILPMAEPETYRPFFDRLLKQPPFDEAAV